MFYDNRQQSEASPRYTLNKGDERTTSVTMPIGTEGCNDHDPCQSPVELMNSRSSASGSLSPIHHNYQQ